MGGEPLLVGKANAFRALATRHHTVFAGQIDIEFILQHLQTPAQLSLGIGEVAGVHAALGLHLAKLPECPVSNLCAFIYALHRLHIFRGEHSYLGVLPHGHGALDFLARGEPHEGVPGADVEVDIRQRLNFAHILHLGHQLEKEAQLANLHRFLHDIYSIKVVEDDGFEDEVAQVGVSFDLSQRLAEIAELFGAVFLTGTLQIVQKDLHTIKAGFVERLQHVQGGKEEGTGTAGGIENGDLRESVPERP
ncbi:MAG: hypothetical protein DDT30_01169 [Dehalococcoidia bacterium]|nr:hypothetical protein [Bacillota bacterium]